ncbi:MAG: AMIN domain-containing protein [Desulfuromonadales bacterium]
MKQITKKTMTYLFIIAMTVVFVPCMVRIISAAPEESQKSASDMPTVTSIGMPDEGDGAELVIRLSASAIFGSYKTADPLSLVVVLNNTTEGLFTTPIPINRGNFKTVTVTRSQASSGLQTIITIGLVKDLESVISTPQGLGELRISFPAPSVPVAAVKGKRPAASPEAGVARAPNEPATAKTAVSNKSTKGQQFLTALTVNNNAIILAIEGGAVKFNSFHLDKPERFIIDIFDVKCLLKSRIIPINSAGITLARIGIYPNKIRIVLDAGNGNFSNATATRTAGGITVTLK